jgi:hypothetical protein
VGVNLIVSGFTRLMYSVAARKTIKAIRLTGCKPSRRGKCFRTIGIACTKIGQDRPPVLAD